MTIRKAPVADWLADRLLNDASRDLSAILCAVGNSVFLLALFLAAGVALPPPSLDLLQPPRQTEQQTPRPETAPPPAVPSGPVILLDPAHGGTDTGARGEGGIAEKDVVLQMARTVRAELERRGYRVVLTRNDDSNPSYDDRAAMANSYGNAIFISLHVSSTGTPGIVRAYYQQFAAPIVPASGSSNLNAKPAIPQSVGLTGWHDAQRNYVGESQHLADLIQSQLAQLFAGSPATATGVPVRVLRSVAAPAIAIEVSSISGSSQDELLASSAPIAAAVVRGIGALLQANPSETK